MYGHIFSPQDWWDMAAAAERLSTLRFEAQGRLTNTLVNIESIGDPYYMDLRADTYFAAIGSESVSHDAILAELARTLSR